MFVNLITLFAAETQKAAEAVQGATEAAHEEAAGIAALGIDPIAILAQAATFLLLFWLIKKYALANIIATLEKRRQTIDDGVRLGQEMALEKERLDEEVEKALAGARAEADKIIAAGHEEAGAIIKEAENTASQKVDTMLAEAKLKIDKDIELARIGLETEIAGLIADATEKIIQVKLDSKKDAVLITNALSEVRN